MGSNPIGGTRWMLRSLRSLRADRALEAAERAIRLKMANVARYDVRRTRWPS